MKNSRRTFFKQGLAGALALGSASLPVSAAAMTDGVGKAKAKRVVLISLDGICVEGFLKARTPNLEALLADGSLSLDTRVVAFGDFAQLDKPFDGKWSGTAWSC